MLSQLIVIMPYSKEYRFYAHSTVQDNVCTCPGDLNVLFVLAYLICNGVESVLATSTVQNAYLAHIALTLLQTFILIYTNTIGPI